MCERSRSRQWQAVVIGVLSTLVGLAAAGSAAAAEVSVTARPSLQGYYVSGDTGRFREDRKTIDQTSGGIEDFSLRTDGLELTGHALAKYDYGTSLRLDRYEPWYVNADVRQFRSYYDGSNEPWDPTIYSLPKSFADHTDDNMYVARTDGTIEGGYHLGDQADLIGGVILWSRDGRETLLRGDLTTATGQVNRRSHPATADVEGRSETYYLELPVQLAEGYDVNVRQSYEFYRDDQDIRFYRYANGSLSQARTFLDYPRFYDLRTQVTVAAEPTEMVYLHGGYLYDWLQNQSLRSEVRPNVANPRTYVEPEVENLRSSHTFNGGMVWQDALWVKGLRFSTSARAEDADTDARSAGMNSGTTRADARSDLSEVRFAESFGAVYAGIPRTTVSFNADFEQRQLHWDEYFDARSHEIVTNFGGPSDLTYQTGIRFTDQVYTLSLVNRPHRLVKWSVKYRQKDKVRDYTKSVDTTAAFYPGRLGDQDEDANELSLKVDVRCPMGWMTGFQYQHVNDMIAFGEITEAAQDLSQNRYSASVFGPIGDQLSVMVTGMIDRFAINTPTHGVATNWNPGSGVYDYDGDVYLFNTAANYALSDKTKLHGTYQQTASQGDNKNILYELWLGAKRELNEGHALEVRYEYFNFHDRRIEGPGFDDYDGHGIYLAMTSTF